MSYKLKSWEKWESEAVKHPPKFCPNCGTKLTDNIQEYWADSSRKATVDNPFKDVGYDCYCENCKWSGNIEPDADTDIIDETTGRKEN